VSTGETHSFIFISSSIAYIQCTCHINKYMQFTPCPVTHSTYFQRTHILTSHVTACVPEGSSLLRCDTVSLGHSLQTFPRIIMPESSETSSPRRKAMLEKSVCYICMVDVCSKWPDRMAGQYTKASPTTMPI
jgi:hypothetical protein